MKTTFYVIISSFSWLFFGTSSPGDESHGLEQPRPQTSGSFRRFILLLRRTLEAAALGYRDLESRWPDSEEHSLWVGEPSNRGKFMLRLERPTRPPKPSEALDEFMTSRLEWRSSKD